MDTVLLTTLFIAITKWNGQKATTKYLNRNACPLSPWNFENFCFLHEPVGNTVSLFFVFHQKMSFRLSSALNFKDDKMRYSFYTIFVVVAAAFFSSFRYRKANVQTIMMISEPWRHTRQSTNFFIKQKPNEQK